MLNNSWILEALCDHNLQNMFLVYDNRIGGGGGGGAV